MTLSVAIHVVAPAADHLGEGPVWLPDPARLVRVDINAPAVIERDLVSGAEARRVLAAPVGFAAPAESGGYVAGVGRQLVRLPSLDGKETVIASVEPERAGNRFNDAACDARGRLWAGTMSTRHVTGAAHLYRVLPTGEVSVALSGVTISNGLDWNADATRLYYIDSTTQQLDAIDFDLDRGRLGARRTLVTIDPRDGLPDGLLVDAEGAVWVCLFGGGVIRRYLPSGALDAEIRLPVTNPTSLAFAGPDLGDLYVTSAKHRLSPEQLRAEPLAGSLLRLRPGGRGRLAHRFGA